MIPEQILVNVQTEIGNLKAMTSGALSKELSGKLNRKLDLLQMQQSLYNFEHYIVMETQDEHFMQSNDLARAYTLLRDARDILSKQTQAK